MFLRTGEKTNTEQFDKTIHYKLLYLQRRIDGHIKAPFLGENLQEIQ